MASKARTGASRGTSLGLVDAISAFMPAYKMWARSVLSEVSSSGSTPSRVMVVVFLRKHGALPMGALASYVGLPKSNITALVDDLEAEGVLRRRRDEGDRRVTHVELTAKGRAVCAKEYDAYQRGIAALFDTMPESERAATLAGIEHLTRLMRSEGEKSSPRLTEAPAAAPSRPVAAGGRRRSA